jgi:hypothetical protein
MSAVAVGHAHEQNRKLFAIDRELTGALLVGLELRIVGRLGVIGDCAEAADVGVIE